MERALILLGGVLLFSDVASAQGQFFPTEAELAADCGREGVQATIRAPSDRSDRPGPVISVVLCHDRDTAERILNYLKLNHANEWRSLKGEYSYSLRSLGCWNWFDSGVENIACAVLGRPQ